MSNQIDTKAEKAKILWTLKDGSTPMNRIYSTVRHLGCKLSYKEVSSMTEDMVRAGELIASPHPFNENEYFYSINQGKG